MTTKEPLSLPSVTLKVVTPDGTMFVHIIESPPGLPFKLDVSMGKAGSSIQAWAQSLSKVISVCLRNGIPISAIAEEIGAENSDRITISNGRFVRSGPAGIAQAILMYLEFKKPRSERRKKGRRGPTVFGEEFF